MVNEGTTECRLVDSDLLNLEERVKKLEKLFEQYFYSPVKKMCGDCNHFCKFAIDETKGVCNEYSRQTFSWFNGCDKWESKQ